jgi:hypothetical protein
MTQAQKITATATTALVLLAAVGWIVVPRGSHEVVLKPTHGVQR